MFYYDSDSDDACWSYDCYRPTWEDASDDDCWSYDYYRPRFEDASERAKAKNALVAEIYSQARYRNLSSTHEDLDVRNGHGYTALMTAVQKYDVRACSYLLEHGADPNITRSFDGDFTALSLACRISASEIMRLLIRHGATFSCENGLRALEAAVGNKFFEDIKLGENIDTNSFQTVINFAYRNNRLDLVQNLITHRVSLEKTLLNTDDFNLIQMLIKAGVNLNGTNNQGKTALHRAINRNQMKTVQLLVEANANIEATDTEGNTPLLCSIAVSQEITEYLIQRGSCVSCANNKGETPLSLAMKHGTLDTVKLLIEKGSDINILNESGKSLLNYPIEKNRKNIVEYLIQLKVNVNVLTVVNDYPLLLAIDTMNLEIIKLLIDAGADVNQKDHSENCALIRALTHRRCSEVVKLLVSAGAIVDCVNKERLPALILALEQGNTEMVKLFLEHGVNVNVKNKNQETALMIAANKNEKEIVQRLIKAGANVNETDTDGNTVMMRITNKKSKKYNFFSETYKHQNHCDQDVLELLKLFINSKADLNIVNHVKDSLLNIALKLRFENLAILLIQIGADPNNLGSECKHPLLIAASEFSAKLVKEIIKTGVDVNVSDSCGDTALFKLLDRVNSMSESEILTAVHLLVQHGASVNHLNINQQSALFIAVEKDILSVAEYLIEVGADVNQCDVRGKNILLRSVNKLNVDLLKALVSAGANVNVVDRHGRNALIRVLKKDISTILKQYQNKTNVYETVKVLVKNGIDVNRKSDRAETALNAAIIFGNIEIVEYLIQSGADVNSLGSCGSKDISKFTIYAPLHLSIKLERKMIFNVLLKAGSDILLKGECGNASIHYAARCKDSHYLRILIKRFETNQVNSDFVDGDKQMNVKINPFVNVKNNSNETALFSAAKYGKIDNVNILIEHGCDINVQSNLKITALSVALTEEFDKIAEILLTAGADIAVTIGKRSIFQLAAQQGCVKSLLWLIKAGVNIYETTGVGGTALNYVTSLETAKLLIQYGLDVNHRDSNGWSPLHMAVRNEHVDLVRYFIQIGSIIDATSICGNTPLMVATKLQNVKLIKMLFDAGADINKQNRLDYSPLIWAARMFSQVTDGSRFVYNMVLEIMKLKPNLNLQTRRGITALMFIAGDKNYKEKYLSSNNKSLLLSLISNGADVNVKDNEHRSALTHCLMAEKVNSELVEVLVQNGADPVLPEKYKFLLKRWESRKDCNGNNFIFARSELLRFFLCNGFVYNMDVEAPTECLVSLLIKNGRLNVLKYLMANCCLGKADFQTLHSTFGKSKYSDTFSKDCTVFEEAMHQPWPLVKLAFIVTSTLLGDGHRRRMRVRETLLPESIQEMLLFQTPVARIPISQWSSIPLCFNPIKYEALSCPRPLLYYWPLGSVQLRWDK